MSDVNPCLMFIYLSVLFTFVEHWPNTINTFIKLTVDYKIKKQIELTEHTKHMQRLLMNKLKANITHEHEK